MGFLGVTGGWEEAKNLLSENLSLICYNVESRYNYTLPKKDTKHTYTTFQTLSVLLRPKCLTGNQQPFLYQEIQIYNAFYIIFNYFKLFLSC